MQCMATVGLCCSLGKSRIFGCTWQLCCAVCSSAAGLLAALCCQDWFCLCGGVSLAQEVVELMTYLCRYLHADAWE